MVSHRGSAQAAQCLFRYCAAKVSPCAAALSYLDQVGVPRITTNVQVIVAKLLSRGLSKYMTCNASLRVSYACFPKQHVVVVGRVGSEGQARQ